MFQLELLFLVGTLPNDFREGYYVGGEYVGGNKA